MRPLENEWGRECMAAYHKHIVKSDPEEDWDARNALYAMFVSHYLFSNFRLIIHLAAPIFTIQHSILRFPNFARSMIPPSQIIGWMRV